MAEQRIEGTVKMYNAEKGFGFITWRPGEDIYVHKTSVERARLGTLNTGDRVSYIAQMYEGRPRAEQLLRVGVTATSTAPSRPPSQSAPPRLDTSTTFQFGPDYLSAGYFEQRDDRHYLQTEVLDGRVSIRSVPWSRGDRRYLRPEVLDSLAINIAKVLGNAQPKMKSSQLRRFFGKARGIEARLDRDGDFHAIVADIYSFKRDVAYQVGRKLVPEEFQQFINRNVELAVADDESFRSGFLQHFESVVAYFVYYFRDQ